MGGGQRPTKPSGLPEARPRLPREVYRDLRGTAPPGELDDVMKVYALAGEALDEGDLSAAKRMLLWARSAAARSPSVREALGVTLYLLEEFSAAERELLAYRRLSGRRDQNHLIADCARAAGRPDRVAQYVAEMRPEDVGEARWVEGLLVLAGDRADRGDLDGALAALGHADLRPANVRPHHARLWYLAAELHERKGEPDEARDYLEAIAALEPDFLDVAQRLEGREHKG